MELCPVWMLGLHQENGCVDRQWGAQGPQRTDDRTSLIRHRSESLKPMSLHIRGHRATAFIAFQVMLISGAAVALVVALYGVLR